MTRRPRYQPTRTAERRASSRLVALALAATAACLACGCGRSVPLGQVEGTVRVDGQPLSQVMVVFIPADPHLPQSFGISDEEGRFELRCNDNRMGAAVGEHRVMLVDGTDGAASEGNDIDAAGIPPAANRIPAIYNRADKTPLRQSVASGAQTIAIDIVSGKKPS
jgi:hypothetical protein